MPRDRYTRAGHARALEYEAEYRSRPEVAEKRAAYMKKYNSRPEVKERAAARKKQRRAQGLKN